MHWKNPYSSHLGNLPFSRLSLCDGLLASSDLFYIALRAFLSLLGLSKVSNSHIAEITRTTHKKALKFCYSFIDLLFQTGQNLLGLFKCKALHLSELRRCLYSHETHLLLQHVFSILILARLLRL